MNKNVGLLLTFLLGYTTAFSQENYIQHPTLGIHFLFHDYRTAYLIRATSLREVLRSGEFGRLKEMSPGLAVNYIYGLSKHFDFSTTLTGAFLDYVRADGNSFGQDNLLLEGDASIRYKVFSTRYWVSPYIQIGTGISKYKGYWGALVPAGVGIQVNLFQEAYLIINGQYRYAVTNSASDHFFYSIGLAGNIGRRKNASGRSTLPND